MKLAFLAFTEKGFALAGSLAQTLGGQRDALRKARFFIGMDAKAVFRS